MTESPRRRGERLLSPSGGIDDDIAALVDAEALEAAGALANSRGQHRLAADLLERACLFQSAAESAYAGEDFERALLLTAAEAPPGSSAGLGERALERMGDEARRRHVASELTRRGHHAWAGRVLETAGLALEAAGAWSLGGRHDRAAELLERLGDPIRASSELEKALRITPDRHDLRLQLGRLLLRHGRTDLGVRTLQRIPEEAPERRAALGDLARWFEALGLPLAAAEAARELSLMTAPSTEQGAVGLGDAPPSPADAVDSVRARLFGRYQVEREVGSTASARVIHCIDTLSGEPIALKIFAGSGLTGVGRDALLRFEREVSILRTLRHPSMVSLRGYLPEGPALALEWMPGGTLLQMLEQGTLAPARAVEIAAAILDALAAAHRAGVIHRDIKPSNVLFDAAGAARLSDFGSAHLGDLAATATAGIIGTFAYMSPEQRAGRPAVIASDLYGVGVMLREMLTGRAPDDDAGTQPSAAHRDLGAAHDAVVARLTDPDPEKRPRDALDARQILLALEWPASVDPIVRPRTAPRQLRIEEERLERLESDGAADLARDRWTGRRVRLVPLNERTLERARAFAAANGQGLDLVLRVDLADKRIWFDASNLSPLERALTKDEAKILSRGLAVLHEARITHGHVDRAHVVMSESGPRLTFTPESAPTTTADLDRIALVALQKPLEPSAI